MIDRVYEIPTLEDNRGLPRRLIVAMPKKRGIINRLETK